MFEPVFYHLVNILGVCSCCGIRAINDALEVVEPTMIIYPYACGPNNHAICQNCAGQFNINCYECDTRRDQWMPYQTPLVTRIFTSLNRYGTLFKCSNSNCDFRSNIFTVALHMIRCCVYKNSFCIGCNVEIQFIQPYEHIQNCSKFSLMPSVRIEYPESNHTHILVQWFDIGVIKRKYTFQTEMGNAVIGFAVNMHETDPPASANASNVLTAFNIAIKYFCYFPGDMETHRVEGFIYNNCLPMDQHRYLSLDFNRDCSFQNVHSATLGALFQWSTNSQLSFSFALRRKTD